MGCEGSKGAAAAAPPAVEEVDETFEASETFQGAKPGKVFKKGPQGVGYYKDKYAS
eukprot:CAMPEP_0178422368 /NCGR_PEP_ID=MMETSP0689_2-20121128/27136_1 /TAXON_ID=160604 /ORGANISM="Amphidinium massartii, Strain CS-259" /LENGTH=55 /DNA_ID=CAMNT_0020043927 /DNA_START=103 /DNA_END=270 /DNA_ORIENTATION=+